MRSTFSSPMVQSHHKRAAMCCLGAALFAISTLGFAQTVPAQETASVPDGQAELVDPVIDAGAVHAQALEAEWAGEYERARELYGPAALAGHARSHYQLGFLMMDGLGGPRDVEQARFHLRQAADGGITLALISLIYTYDDQDDPSVAPDPILASRSLLELSQRDLASAGDTIMFWSRPLRRQVQRDLREAGFYSGAIDGLIGQGSLNALRGFARARTELPVLPERRFEILLINADGIAHNGGTPTALDSIETLADLRSALETLPAIATDETHWRIFSGDEPVLDWPRPSPSADAEVTEGEVTGGDETEGEEIEGNETAQAVVTFQLPGKPTATDLTFGAAIENFTDLDQALCAVRTAGPGPYEGRYLRRCETRVPGVQLVFVAHNGPSPDLEAEVSRIHGVADEEPRGETLAAIEINPPLSLRLAGN